MFVASFYTETAPSAKGDVDHAIAALQPLNLNTVPAAFVKKKIERRLQLAYQLGDS